MPGSTNSLRKPMYVECTKKWKCATGLVRQERFRVNLVHFFFRSNCVFIELNPLFENFRFWFVVKKKAENRGFRTKVVKLNLAHFWCTEFVHARGKMYQIWGKMGQITPTNRENGVHRCFKNSEKNAIFEWFSVVKQQLQKFYANFLVKNSLYTKLPVRLESTKMGVFFQKCLFLDRVHPHASKVLFFNLFKCVHEIWVSAEFAQICVTK